ncbi:hypothetical protein Sjap_009213 [Stephania japonica]|uniref:Uncharacterized protein n=1 Tax=Stephania japonica TaxID=461633 RepID=A0AAP0JRR6_9MAGN
MQNNTALKLTFRALTGLAFLLQIGQSAECGYRNKPTIQQTQVGFGSPPKFMVEVQNKCPMCPVINIHVKCVSFTQDLVDPRKFKVLNHSDCVVNSGLPLAPLQKVSFNYSHNKFLMSTSNWNFQCE